MTTAETHQGCNVMFISNCDKLVTYLGELIEKKETTVPDDAPEFTVTTCRMESAAQPMDSTLRLVPGSAIGTVARRARSVAFAAVVNESEEPLTATLNLDTHNGSCV